MGLQSHWAPNCGTKFFVFWEVRTPIKQKTIWEKKHLWVVSWNGIGMDSHLLSKRRREAMKNLRFSEPCYAPPGVHDESTCSWPRSSWMPNINRSNGLIFSMRTKIKIAFPQLEENKYPKMPNNIAQLLSLVSAMRFKLFFNYKHFSSRMARISNKALRISKDLSMFASENLPLETAPFSLTQLWWTQLVTSSAPPKKRWRLSPWRRVFVKGCTQQPRVILLM